MAVAKKKVTKPTATRGRPPKKAKPEGLVDMAGKEESSTTEVYHSNNIHDCISKMDVIDLSEVSPVNRLVFFQSLADAGYLRCNGRELMEDLNQLSWLKIISINHVNRLVHPVQKITDDPSKVVTALTMQVSVDADFIQKVDNAPLRLEHNGRLYLRAS